MNTRSHSLAPSSQSALESALSDAASRKRGIYVVGGGRAFSAIDVGDDLCVKPPRSAPRDADEPLHDSLEAEAPTWVGPGVDYDALQAHLARRARTLINVPGWGGLDVVGSISTGSHGSGLHIGPLSNMVRAVRLLSIDASGRPVHWHIERAAGATRDAQHDGFRVLREDAVFDAATVNLGALGVVTEMLLATRPAFALEENRSLVSWDTIAPTLLARVEDPGLHSAHVWINPYSASGDNAVLSTFHETSAPLRGRRPLAMRYGGRPIVRAIPYALLRYAPLLTPTMHTLALRATRCRSIVQGSFDALTLGSANDVPVVGAGLAVAFESSVRAAEAVVELLRRRARDFGTYLTTPLALRFVAAGDALMSPQHGRRTTMIEVALVRGTAGVEDTMNAALSLLIERFDARPHWGQHLGPRAREWLERHPGIAQFRAAKSSLDPLDLFGGAGLRRALRARR